MRVEKTDRYLLFVDNQTAPVNQDSPPLLAGGNTDLRASLDGLLINNFDKKNLRFIY